MIKEDGEIVNHGWTKLYHPRGPHVSLPVTGDTPAAMFACVSAMLDAGFVVAAPGLEVGEEREQVSAVLRSTFERDGEETPTVLLYSANTSLEWSFLKIYLNDEADIVAFQQACHVKLLELPVYDGKDKPKRDGSSVSKKYIVNLAKPVPVVFKQNPKWSEEENAKAIAAQKPYTIPKRIFVRWADAPPPAPPGDGTPPLTDMQVVEAAWKARLQGVQVLDDLNKLLPMVKAIVEEPVRKLAWGMCVDFGKAKNWVFDKDDKKVFRHAVEMTATPSPTKPAVATPPPPPDDTPPLIAAWQKRLVLENANLAKLNGPLVTDFKSIGKTEPARQDVWIMLSEFAQQHGFKFDASAMKFVANAGVPDYPN